MASFPLVISCYTVNTLYQLEVQGLLQSCIHWGIEHCIEGVPSLGSWELNCGYKPFFILEKLMQHQRPVLWVDADGVFVSKPEWISAFEGDLSVRMNDDCPDGHLSKVVSSTVYVNWTKKGVDLVKRWAEECYVQLNNPDRQYEYWDQAGLRDVIFSPGHGGSVIPLPHTYAKIFDQKGESLPVIEHFQASRRLKKVINGTC